VGAENKAEAIPFQLSQRADFFETEVGLDTMLRRPIINTRDEPHADRAKYRRLHVITGDVNMSEYATYLKLGATAIILSMIEDKVLDNSLKLENPIAAMRQVSRDVSCSQPLRLANGKHATAVEIQQRLFEKAAQYAAANPCGSMTGDILMKWEHVLSTLAHAPEALNRELDWVIKYDLLHNYCHKHQCGWDDPRVAMIDLQYHDIRPEKGLFYILQRQQRIERILSDDEIAHAVAHPPEDTRAYFRGECLQRYRADVYGVSWGAISFNVGQGTVKRILMPDPGKGTRQHVQELLEKSQTAEELLTNILH